MEKKADQSNLAKAANKKPRLFSPLAAVKHWAEQDPKKLLLTFVAIENDCFVEEKRTAQELLDNGKLLASAFEKAGLKKGDRFAIVMRNHPEFVEAMVASEIAGTIFVPVDVRVQPERLDYMIRHSECKGAIMSKEGLEKLVALKEWPQPLEWVWVIDSDETELSKVTPLQEVLQTINREEALARNVNPRPLHEPMQLLFTSGTTGDPKAIQSTYHRFASVGALGTVLGVTQEDRPYTGLSLSHANAQLISLGYSFNLGLPLVISRKFTKSRLWEIVSRYKCTVFHLLGGMAPAIFAEPESPYERNHQVRFVLSAGMPAAMWKEFEKRFNVKIFEFYATAEGGVTINPPGVGPVGSIGKSLPGTICEILDENDQPCQPYEVGEICFRNEDGNVEPVNYYKNPEASQKKTEGGWFRSGDYGYKDEEGWVYFSYRGGGAIRRNGEFVDVNEMITALAKHPHVSDVYVYGVPLKSNAPGEKTVFAAVVLQDKQDLVIEEFLTSLKEIIGNGAYPDYIQVIDEIPKTASEKPIDRYLIQHLITGTGVIISIKGDIVERIDNMK